MKDWACRKCRKEWKAESADVQCPYCQSYLVDEVRGQRRIYTWKCCKCESIIELKRYTVNHRKPPDRCPKPGCTSLVFTRFYERAPQALMHEHHRSPFKDGVTIKKAQKNLMCDENGKPIYRREVLGHTEDGTPVFSGQAFPVVQYEDVTFTSKFEQDEWLKRKGMVRTLDGRDPSVGPSQHSVYDQRQTPPPGLGINVERAESLAKSSRFLVEGDLRKFIGS